MCSNGVHPTWSVSCYFKSALVPTSAYLKGGAIWVHWDGSHQFTNWHFVHVSHTKRTVPITAITSIQTRFYHRQTERLAEWLNKTSIHEDEPSWDHWLDPILFVVGDFLPLTNCLSGTCVGAFDLIKENCEQGPSQAKNEIHYVLDLRAKLYTLGSNTRAPGPGTSLVPVQQRGKTHLEVKCLYCSFLLAQGYLPSAKDPLWSNMGWLTLTMKREEPHWYITSIS